MDAVGVASTVKKSEVDVAETVVPAVEMVTETCLAPVVVPDPMTSLTLVAPRREHAAALPPTVALHEAAASCAVVMKLAPVTVMLLLT